MATPNPRASDGGSGPGQLSAAPQPAQRPPCLPRGSPQCQPLSSWPSALTDTVHPSPHALVTPPSLHEMAPGGSLPPTHPAGTPFCPASQIQTKPRIVPVTAVYHFEIYTILAERTELYCIHDAIKHFTRNQCKTDEA